MHTVHTLSVSHFPGNSEYTSASYMLIYQAWIHSLVSMYHTPYNKTIDAQMSKELFSPYFLFGFVIKYIYTHHLFVCHCVQPGLVGSTT